MKKALLAIFIIVDLALIAGAGVFLYARLTQKPLPFGLKSGSSMGMSTSAPVVSPPPAMNASDAMVSSSSPTASTSAAHPLLTPTTIATSSVAGVRHIGFTYSNSKAHKVDIKADFTQWKSEAMQLKNGVWTYVAALPPGEYEYCFIVDDSKGIRDPKNKRTKQIGTTFVSAIVVTPPPAKPK